MALEDNDTTWILALESAIYENLDVHEIINITKGRVLPEEYRSKVWYLCLGGGSKLNGFEHFDEIFDLPEQAVIRSHCKTVIDRLGNEEHDKIPIICDIECIFTHHCKSRHITFDSKQLWSDILTPLLAVKMPRNNMYACFEEILEKYIPRETEKGAPIYHLLRLILLYHDPQLSTFLDSKKIYPDLFAVTWMKSLFASVCTLDAILPLWDIYFQERDPFFIVFLALIIIVNAREEIISLTDDSREKIVQRLVNIPSALTVDDVTDFCSLARYYAVKTPTTFRNEFSTQIFGSIYLGNIESNVQVGSFPLSQALCVPVSAEEILETGELLKEVPPTDPDQVGFFLVDCRPSEQYNAGHLPNAFHLDSSLMLQQPASFKTAVQGLFLAQRQALSSGTLGCGKHLCFIGSGREIEDQYVHMVVASFLQRDTQYVSLAKGGYQAIHDLLSHNLSENLSDHDSSQCICCIPFSSRPESIIDVELHSKNDFPDNYAKKLQNSPKKSQKSSFSNKFSTFSSVFKSKSMEMKDKLVDYINNPIVDNHPQKIERHVSPSDRGKLYKGTGDVFSINEDPDSSHQDINNTDQYEKVNITQWIKKPDIKTHFKCHQVQENGYMYPSVILCTQTLMYVIKESEDSETEGYVTARRNLSSIVKITSKKRHADFITFKYGSTLGEGDVVVTDMDRFLIPNASEATKAIKNLLI